MNLHFKIYRIALAFIVFLYSCQSYHESTERQKIHKHGDSLRVNPGHKDSVKADAAGNSYITRKFLDTLTPIWGERLSVNGDFDGDGKEEKLTEIYYSIRERKETCKDYEGIAYDTAVAIACYKDPYSFLLSSNKKIDTLRIAKTGQLFGVLYIKNEGDLNGDGTDEISYVADWADWSALNTMHIVTYKDQQWKNLYSFSFMEYQLDSDQPFIRKVSDNIIEIQSLYSIEGEEFDGVEKYIQIDLRNPPEKY